MNYRKSTYPAALKMAALIHELHTYGKAIPLDDLLEMCETSERNIRRYFKALNEMSEHRYGKPLIQKYKVDDVEKWRLTDEWHERSTEYQIMSLYMGAMLMSFLEDTVIKSGLMDLFDFMQQALPRSQRKLLRNHEKKFFYTSFGQKTYRDFDDQIDQLLQAIILQYAVEIVHNSKEGLKKHHVLPYTLIIHKGAMYLYGFVETYEENRLFMVDKLKSVKCLKDDPFEYPENYHPESVIQSAFGIYQGDKSEQIEVVIEFDDRLYDYIANRQWIPNQEIIDKGKGKYHFRVYVDDLREIFRWVLSLGSQVRVVKPRVLKNKVLKEVENLTKLY